MRTTTQDTPVTTEHWADGRSHTVDHNRSVTSALDHLVHEDPLSLRIGDRCAIDGEALRKHLSAWELRGATAPPIDWTGPAPFDRGPRVITTEYADRLGHTEVGLQDAVGTKVWCTTCGLPGPFTGPCEGEPAPEPTPEPAAPQNKPQTVYGLLRRTLTPEKIATVGANLIAEAQIEVRNQQEVGGPVMDNAEAFRNVSARHRAEIDDVLGATQ